MKEKEKGRVKILKNVGEKMKSTIKAEIVGIIEGMILLLFLFAARESVIAYAHFGVWYPGDFLFFGFVFFTIFVFRVVIRVRKVDKKEAMKDE